MDTFSRKVPAAKRAQQVKKRKATVKMEVD